MKVQFSREVEFTPSWNGNKHLPDDEKIIVTLKPLEMEDLIKLMDTLQEASGGEIDRESLTAVSGQNIGGIRLLITACGDLIPRYCEIDGLEDDSGPVLTKEIVKFPYYMELCAEILSELAEVSMPNEVEEKNLEPQPDIPSTTTH